MSINLKEARKKKGLTQKDLAQALDVSQSNVSNYEKGNYQLSSEQIIKLVKVLECSADYLLGLIDEPQLKQEKKSKPNG
jgi:HTH-type transcriptional regulator, competence development regulator